MENSAYLKEAFILSPAFKDYIWGGTRLRDDFGKTCDFERIAESWELSCHKDGLSVIASGSFKGKTLAEYIRDNPVALGTACDRFEDFPIITKLIDAKDNLSVQVHPDNDYARAVEGGFGKTEMWYVLEAEEGAQLIYGFKDKISKDEFREKIMSGTLLDSVNYVPVRKGDFFFIESGTLHAIGKGIVIAEIQQNSNTTYRVFDYGRKGADGKPRQLHIDKAVDVTSLEPPVSHFKGETKLYSGYTKTLLVRCEYFTVYTIEINGEANLIADGQSFVHILVTDGKIMFSSTVQDTVVLEKGSSFFIPAGYGDFELVGKAQIVITDIE